MVVPKRHAADWQEELEIWLEPFLDVIGRAERRHWAPVYLRGLLGSAERKNVEQMAAEVCPDDVQQLHHFVSTSPWPVRPLQRVLVQKANVVVGGEGAVLIVDDTGLVKKGTHSVGVARQYLGELGKRANGQVLVTLTLARGGVPVPIALRLFLPQAWADDPARCRAAGVPDDEIRHRPKWKIALAELDLALEAGATFVCLLADAEYGKVAAFRHALTGRGLRYAVGMQPHQKVYSADVELEWPEPSGKGGRPRKYPVPSEASERVDAFIDALGEDAFREIAWRDGTQGPLRAKFAAVRVRVADGPRASNGQRLPAEETRWLVCERRRTGERKYYVCNHAPNTSLRTLARHIKARWSCEQAHKQMKNELGLDHLECRSWRALHHHALTVALACCFLQDHRTRGKNEHGPTPPAAAQGAAPRAEPAGRAAPLARGAHAGGDASMSKLR